MKTVFNLLISLFIISCNNESDPAPDIASKIEGVYLYELVDTAIGAPVHYSVNWTITRVTDNKINVKHNQSEWVENSAVIGSLGYTFKNIEISKDGKFTIDETVNWSFSDPTAKSDMLINGELVGRNLDVNVKETTLEDNDTVNTRFVLLRQSR